MISSGKGIGLGFDVSLVNKYRKQGSASYLDPSVKEALVGIWIADQNNNDSPTRNIIKNKLKDRGSDFEIQNAAYTDGSGYKDGAFFTDGVDDLIVSQKTVQEMLGGSNDITVVSMIHQITATDKENQLSYNNYIRSSSLFARNNVKNIGKTGIYGYIYVNNAISNVNTILGDKSDYTVTATASVPFTNNFFVEGYMSNSGVITELSQVAWYWTFIANRVLTTDEINQVIAYYNLDKYVKPDVYYDVKKQGISNNTPDVDWYLKDFSGNGRDMQLYNYGKTPESGINEEGGLQSDGVTDYGQYVGDLELKDYTIAIDRAYVEAKASQVPIISNAINLSDSIPFIMEYLSREMKVSPNSFGVYTTLSELNINRFISYQNTYKYGSTNITRGTSTDTGSGLTIGRKFGSSVNYCNIALWSLLLFPYSLSEFLLERQLKRYKLGTLYPDMVEWRPIIKSNGSYEYIKFYISRELAVNGRYYTPQIASVQIKPNGADVPNISVNGKPLALEDIYNGIYRFVYSLDKSPQKINITIDEYIRYEDIVQPYPTLFRLIDAETNYEYTYGDKLKVGSKVKFISYTNLLPELYNPNGNGKYNGDIFYTGTIITIEKTVNFSWSLPFTYLKANEPNCILAPQILRIPNSSYKILGYIPDLTGKGNHGVFNNFSFTEESGVDSNGIVHFDGVDDFITIPTLSHGAKQVLMKVNWQEINRISYDQRNGNTNAFAIYTSDEGNFTAYNAINNGQTYIDGVLNSAIMASQLKDITHNITITNDNVTNTNTISPIIGRSYTSVLYSKMALFSFMSFDEISDENEIKELNDIVGIEGGYVESPDYYWDAYGKSNSDADRAIIIDQVNKEAANALAANNFAFNEESGYVDNGLVSDGVDDELKNTNMPVLTDYTWIIKRKRLNDANSVMAYKGNAQLHGAFMFELLENAQYTRSFSATNNAVEFPELISYQTKTNYNGKNINAGIETDGNTLYILRSRDEFPYYCKAVFYKAMLYDKTIDMLSINMLKNLFAKDELIDVNNPIFKTK